MLELSTQGIRQDSKIRHMSKAGDVDSAELRFNCRNDNILDISTGIDRAWFWENCAYPLHHVVGTPEQVLIPHGCDFECVG